MGKIYIHICYYVSFIIIIILVNLMIARIPKDDILLSSIQKKHTEKELHGIY